MEKMPLLCCFCRDRDDCPNRHDDCDVAVISATQVIRTAKALSEDENVSVDNALRAMMLAQVASLRMDIQEGAE